MGKNILRGRMLMLGQTAMNSEEKEKAEELANLLWHQQDINFGIIKKKNANIHDEEKAYANRR